MATQTSISSTLVQVPRDDSQLGVGIVDVHVISHTNKLLFVVRAGQEHHSHAQQLRLRDALGVRAVGLGGGKEGNVSGCCALGVSIVCERLEDVSGT